MLLCELQLLESGGNTQLWAFFKKKDPVDLENCQQHVTAPAVAKFHAVLVQR